MYLPKRRALSLHLVPALGNQEEDVPGAIVGLWERMREPPRLVERGDVLQHLLLAERLVGLLARKGQDLPEGHAEGPDVAFRRVFALLEGKHDLVISTSRTNFNTFVTRLILTLQKIY